MPCFVAAVGTNYPKSDAHVLVFTPKQHKTKIFGKKGREKEQKRL